MHTKIIYVLVSTCNDIYYEQTLLSAYTLRHYNCDALVNLVVDVDTEKTLYGTRGEIRQYVDEVIVANVPTELSPMQKSRFIKTTLRTIIEGDFFYLDGDTLICGNLERLDNIYADIAAVPDVHGKASQSPWYINQNKLVNNLFGTNIVPNSYYYNGGAVLVKNTKASRSFFERWHKNWCISKDKGCNLDQPAFYNTHRQMNDCVAKLDDIYNCQLSCSFTYFHPALILHYWGSSISEDNPFVWAKKSFFLEIKGKGHLTDEAKSIALNCKTEIPTPSILLAKKSYYDFFNSEFGIRIIKEFERHSLFLKLMQVILRTYQKATRLYLSITK